MIWLVLALAATALGGWLLARTTETALEEARAAATGRFVTLSQGQTHYEWHGPEDGRIMVCVHGLSTPSYVWDPILPLLTAQGYRVLTYDLFGRGASDRVPGPQTREFFLRQLRELLAALGVEAPVTLCGYSMGGAIATARAVEAPDSLTRLILIAPAGLDVDLGAFPRLVARIPVLGDWLQAVAGPVWYFWTTARGAGDTGAERDIAARVIEDLRVEGSLAAILSSQRNLLSEEMDEDHRLIAKTGLPVTAIWGAEDPVIPLSALGRLAAANRNAVQVQIEGAGHALTYAEPEKVARAIADSL